MEFGLKTCGVLLMKRGKKVRFDGIYYPFGWAVNARNRGRWV